MRIYKKGNKSYISVTTLVDMRYPFDNKSFVTWAIENGYDPDWITKTSSDLGERYHAYFENRFFGISDWADVIESDQDKMYKEASEKFFADGWEIIDSERQVFNDTWNFAGRYDCLLRNKRLGIDKALGDIKSYGAWKGAKYKRDNYKIKKLSMQLTLYSMSEQEKLPLIGIFPDITGNYTIESIPEDTSVLDWLKENQLEIVKLLEEEDDTNNTNRA